MMRPCRRRAAPHAVMLEFVRPVEQSPKPLAGSAAAALLPRRVHAAVTELQLSLHRTEGSIAEPRNGNATSSRILVSTYSTILKCRRSSQYDHERFQGGAAPWDSRNVGRLLGGNNAN